MACWTVSSTILAISNFRFLCASALDSTRLRGTISTRVALLLVFLGTCHLLCVRMGLVVRGFHVLCGQMGVNHCGFDVLMSEKFLHDAQICPALQQMRSKGAAQRVRVDIPQAGAMRHCFYYKPN